MTIKPLQHRHSLLPFFPLLIVAILFLDGCGSHTVAPPAITIIDSSLTSRLANTREARSRIENQYTTWQGTRYTLGGMSTRGVDCSGFIVRVYRSTFGIGLPRTVQELVEVGAKVEQDNLLSGDLIFFKTGFKARHVGIYIGSGKFVHAAVNKGVSISQLNTNYWQKRYWTARRIRV